MKKKSNLIIPWHLSVGMRKILMQMKLTFIFILVAAIQTFAIDSYSQNTMLTLKMNNSTVKDVLQQIEDQSEFYFLYSSKIIDVDRKVNVQADKNRVDDILNKVFQGTDVMYAIEGRQIVLTSSEIRTKSESAQSQRVSGVIKSTTGEVLPGVTVAIKGTSVGTISDVDGKYTLNVPDNGKELVFSFIGMETQTIAIGNSTVINVTMNSADIGLEEVVAIGYGTVKKSDVTGSVVSVGSAELTSRPVNNALEAMQGRAAGVDITASQRPGTLGNINIRGVRSLTASNEPLYVVDGVPIMTESQSYTERLNDVKKSSGIETLNPQDIESIDILKDASATAIYGSRGANGVVLITTKRGSEGKISLKYSGSVTSESMAWRSRYMDAQEYIEFIRWAAYNKNPTALTPGDQPSLANDSKIELFTADPTAWANLQKGWAGGSWDASKLESYDWMSEVTQPNITQEHTVSASGGNKSFKAYASVGYLDNQGTTKGQEYQRYTFKTSVDVKPKEWLNFGTTMNATWSYQDFGQANIGGSMTGFGNNLVETAARIYPYALPYDVNGVKIAYPGGQSRVATIINEWEYSTNQRETMRILGSLYTEIKLFDGLRYRMNFGPDLRFYRNGIYNDGKSVIRGGSSYANYSGNKNFSWTIDNLLYYDKTFGMHSVGATLLQTASKYTFESYGMAAQGIPISSMQWYSLGSVSALDSWSTSLSERQLASYMARVNYGFNNKYLLTLSGRWDGASQLADGSKWAFFPSAALGWRIEQEEFMKDIEWVNQLKLRLGYGATGNSAVNPYTTKGEINMIQHPFGNTIVNGYTTTNSLSNKGLGWERTSQYNVGLDFSIYKGRVSGVIDVYSSHTTDLLMTMALSTVSGFNSSLANIGETKNRGIDISINTVNVQSKDFIWESRLNAAWQKDEIVSLMNGKEDMIDNVWFIGQPISVIYNYERLGLWQDTQEDQAEMVKFNANGHKFQPGMVKVKDQNDDYKITANYDRVILGNTLPRFTLGFNNDFKYKNWDLSIFITGRMKYMRNVSQALTGMYGDQRMLDYWTPNNTDAEYQKPFRDEAGGDSYADTYFRDDSYLKIRNISLGYALPKSVIGKLGISSAKVYAQSRDAGLLWSNNKFLDPEYGGLYFNRGLVFGVSVEF